MSSANEALLRLDLLQKYTVAPTATLKFTDVTEEAALSSSRTSSRRTAVLKLVASSADAAAFLFRSGSYNLGKLERQLEGVLIGMYVAGNAEVPKRLRIDTKISIPDSEALGPKLLQSEVTSTPREQAVGKAFEKGSAIDLALQADSPLKAAAAQLITWCESESIGPSVAYARAAFHVAKHISERKRKKTKGTNYDIEVLDLFSGSGYCARTLACHEGRWLVYCVDNAVSASDAGVKKVENIIWLKMDAANVGEDQVLDLHFELVCADPPHGNLFEIVFCKPTESTVTHRKSALLKTIKAITDWIVLYPGHLSQIGRARTIRDAISDDDWRGVLVQIGSEVVIIASKCDGFDEAVTEILDTIKVDSFLKKISWDKETRILRDD